MLQAKDGQCISRTFRLAGGLNKQNAIKMLRCENVPGQWPPFMDNLAFAARAIDLILGRTTTHLAMVCSGHRILNDLLHGTPILQDSE
jgi:hypothetical protein